MADTLELIKRIAALEVELNIEKAQHAATQQTIVYLAKQLAEQDQQIRLSHQHAVKTRDSRHERRRNQDPNERNQEGHNDGRVAPEHLSRPPTPPQTPSRCPRAVAPECIASAQNNVSLLDISDDDVGLADRNSRERGEFTYPALSRQQLEDYKYGYLDLPTVQRETDSSGTIGATTPMTFDDFLNRYKEPVAALSGIDGSRWARYGEHAGGAKVIGLGIMAPNLPKPSACIECGKEFESRNKLQRHLRNEHALDNDDVAQMMRSQNGTGLERGGSELTKPSGPDGFAPFNPPKLDVCNICGEQFGCRNDLLRHLRTGHIQARGDLMNSQDSKSAGRAKAALQASMHLGHNIAQVQSLAGEVQTQMSSETKEADLIQFPEGGEEADTDNISTAATETSEATKREREQQRLQELQKNQALVMFLPTPSNKDAYRTVLVTDIPSSMSVASVLSHVRGGPLVSVRAMNTTPIMGGETMAITFLHGPSAASFVASVADRRSPRFTLLSTPTWPTNGYLHGDMTYNGVTRCLAVYRLEQDITMQALRAVLAEPGTNHDAIIRAERDGLGTVHLEFSSVVLAQTALERTRRHPWFRFAKVEFAEDPCDCAVEEALEGRLDTEEGEQRADTGAEGEAKAGVKRDHEEEEEAVLGAERSDEPSEDGSCVRRTVQAVSAQVANAEEEKVPESEEQKELRRQAKERLMAKREAEAEGYPVGGLNYDD